MSNGVGGYAGLFLFGALFAGIGGFVGFYFGKPLVDEAKASESWPTVQGQVTESQLESHTDDGSTTYSAHVIYEYTANNEQLDSDRIWFGGDYSTSNRSEMQKIVRDHPVGKQVTVYYSPDSPSEAVLMPGAYFSTYVIFMIGMIFLSVGGLMMLIPAGRLGLSVVGSAGTGEADAESVFADGGDRNDPFEVTDDDWQKRFPTDGR